MPVPQHLVDRTGLGGEAFDPTSLILNCSHFAQGMYELSHIHRHGCHSVFSLSFAPAAVIRYPTALILGDSRRLTWMCHANSDLNIVSIQGQLSTEGCGHLLRELGGLRLQSCFGVTSIVC